MLINNQHGIKSTGIKAYRPVLVLLLILASLPCFPQQWREADSLRNALQHTGTDTGRVSTYLRLAEFQIFKPGELKADLDSAAAYLAQAQQLGRNIHVPEITGHLAYTTSELAKEQGRKAQGKALVTQAINILDKSMDKYLLGQAYLSLFRYYNYEIPEESKIQLDLLHDAATAFEASGNIERQAMVYKLLGELDDPVELTIKDHLHALALYQSIHYKDLQGIYDALGADYMYATDLKQALYYEMKALAVAKEQHDSTMQLCEIYNHIGITHNKLNEPAEAVPYFEAGLHIAKTFKDTGAVTLLAVNICRTEELLDHPQRILDVLLETTKDYPLEGKNIYHSFRLTTFFIVAYTRLNQLAQAGLYSSRLLALIDHNPGKVSNDILVDAYGVLIEYLLQSKQYNRILPYLKKNDAMLKQRHSPLTSTLMNYKAWFRLDSAQHHYKDALEHYLAYALLRDSTFSLEKTKQIKQLQVQFETREKESQITLLNQKNTLQQNNLNHVNLVKNVTIAGIILVLIIAILLYRQSALRKKTNKVVTRKNELITEKNELLQSLVAEKEWLLKEVHHRVKNNLHSVICLLEAQAAYLENDALAALENSQHRIYTMSLIHQKLYQSDDVKTIDMGTYIPELVQYLRDSFATGGQIHFNMAIAPIPLNAAQAIPLGLIINEALTNSIKYAFPEARRGEISVSLSEQDGQYELMLADNGIGMHAGTGGNKSSLGLELMKGLAKEIRGSIHIETHNGVKIIVRFEHDALHHMDALQDDYLASA